MDSDSDSDSWPLLGGNETNEEEEEISPDMDSDSDSLPLFGGNASNEEEEETSLDSDSDSWPLFGGNKRNEEEEETSPDMDSDSDSDSWPLFGGNESNEEEEEEEEEEETFLAMNSRPLFGGNESNEEEEASPDMDLWLLFGGNESNKEEEETSPDMDLWLLFGGNESNEEEETSPDMNLCLLFGENENSGKKKENENIDDEGNEEENGSSVSSKIAEVAMLKTPKALVTSQSTMKIHDIQSSLQSAFKALEYYKERDGQFNHVEAECVRVKAERDQLSEKKNKIVYDLQKTKQEARSYKKKFEIKSVQTVQLQARFAALEQDLKCAKEENCRIYKEKEKMTEELEYSRLQVEYYKRIDNLKGALKSVAEFPGLRQVLQRKNNSDPGSSKKQTGVGTEVSTKRRYVLNVHEIDDSLNCPICFEPWSKSAEHSICSLACGHFFGRSCITSWIKMTRTGSSKCPQCLRSATLKDIRNHYVPQTFVGDEKI